MGDHGLHRRIETVQLAQLQGQAFGEIARADPGRLEGLDHSDGPLDPLRRNAEPFGDFLGAFAQIAGRVDGVDHGEADHPLDRIVAGERQLRAQNSARLLWLAT